MNLFVIAFLGLVVLNIIQQLMIWGLIKTLEKSTYPKIYKRK